MAEQKNRGLQIGGGARSEALRRRGESREKAVRTGDFPRRAAACRGGNAGRYEDCGEVDLHDRAREIGSQRRSTASRRQLLDALRDH